jgi:hypothetical protein
MHAKLAVLALFGLSTGALAFPIANVGTTTDVFGEPKEFKQFQSEFNKDAKNFEKSREHEFQKGEKGIKGAEKAGKEGARKAEHAAKEAPRKAEHAAKEGVHKAEHAAQKGHLLTRSESLPKPPHIEIPSMFHQFTHC